MFKIVILRGGLGNQMFGYAFVLALKNRYPFSIVLCDPLESWFTHNGFELGVIFPKIKVRKYKFYRRLMKFYTQYLSKKMFFVIKESSHDYGCFNERYLYNNSNFILYDGYWQTENYFTLITPQIREYFTFDITKLNEQSINLISEIDKCHSVSVHVRRGDYLNHSEVFGDICTVEYYQNAIAYLEEKYDNLFFFFFSDDSEWVKKVFLMKNSIVVDFNTDAASWQDMCLMSMCKHNVIANSTFSWWGAWLNKNSVKTVIAPKKWFRNNHAVNITPDSWILI